MEKDIGKATVKTSDPDALLKALHTRGKYYDQMYEIYGAERVARIKFQNYIGSQKTIAAMVSLFHLFILCIYLSSSSFVLCI